MKKNRAVVGIVGAASGLSSILGWYVYFSGGDVSGICWPFVWLGIFTWDDGMIIGTCLFAACLCLWLWRKDDFAVSGLFLSAYAALRSFIEAQYNLNAQFSAVTRPWEAFLPPLAASLHLRLVELFVIAQISYTMICLAAVCAFVYFLKEYLMQ